MESERVFPDFPFRVLLLSHNLLLHGYYYFARLQSEQGEYVKGPDLAKLGGSNLLAQSITGMKD